MRKRVIIILGFFFLLVTVLIILAAAGQYWNKTEDCNCSSKAEGVYDEGGM